MYNVVLAAVLLAGGESTAWHHSACYGCSGCYGYSGYQRSYSSCYGCSGCYGYSGYNRGCYGCGGCSGYYSSSCYGCYGCGGCSGYYSSSCYGCYGCSGCYGGYNVGYSYYSSGCSGCFGCSGGGVVIAMPAYSSCYGCCGGVITMPAATVPVAPHVVMPSAGDPKATAAEIERLERLLKELRERAKKTTAKEKDLEESVSPIAPSKAVTAKVTVNLPADARLWVDKVECPLTSAVRTFDTPALQPGQTYFYTVRIEVQRDGRSVSDSQRVVVTAGQQVTVNFAVPAVATAQR